MKKMFFLAVALIATTVTFAQQSAKGAAQPSPAAKAEGTIGNSNISISYHQPAVKGRKIWGELVPFDKIWRTGANNATTITVDKDVKIGGKSLPAGRYALLTIPTASSDWIIIFNKDADQWGAYSYDEKKDEVRVKAKPTKSDAFNERMTFAIKEKSIVLMWENLAVSVDVE
jgi:hypothetical protein